MSVFQSGTSQQRAWDYTALPTATTTPGKTPHVLICVEDVGSVELLCFVLESLGWEASSCSLIAWLDGQETVQQPDILVLGTWLLHYPFVAQRSLARLARSNTPLVLLLDSETDRDFAPIFRAAGTISPLCSLDDLVVCFEQTLRQRESGQPRLLIVEDYAPLRFMLQRSLADTFTIVGAAGDGASAVMANATCHPDVIVMDYHIPQCDGIEAARQIKQQPRPPKIVLFTSEEDEQLARRAAQAGIDAVVQKNGDLRELEAALVHVLSQNGMVPMA